MRGLALPRQLHRRRADHDGRVRGLGLHRGERLHGLAEPLLVGQERAPLRERVAHPGALERPQLAAEHGQVDLRVFGERQRHGLLRPPPLVAQLAPPHLRAVGDLEHALVVGHELV